MAIQDTACRGVDAAPNAQTRPAGEDFRGDGAVDDAFGREVHAVGHVFRFTI